MNKRRRKYVQLPEQFSLFDKNPAALKGEKSNCESCYTCVKHESHRCRNAFGACPPGFSYSEYTGSSVRQCIGATVELYQDGYIHCPVIEMFTCEQCFEKFRSEEFSFDESQNYERTPRW